MTRHMITRAVAATGFVAGMSATAAAQVPAPVQDRPVALIGATIHPVTGPVIQNGTIVFENGRITAVGANVAIPPNAERVDVSGKHIYPGLVSAASEIGLFEVGAVDVTIDVNELGDFNPNVRAEVAFHPESRHIGTTRSNGVLITVTTPSGGLISGHSAAMMLDGWTWETMLLKSRVGLMINWPGSNNENQYAERLGLLREFFRQARAYRTMAKGSSGTYASDARLEAMIPVLEGTTPVIVNANGVRNIQDAVTWAEEEQVRIIILGGQDAEFITDFLVAKQVPVLLTSVQDAPNHSWQGYDATYAAPAKLHAAGVKFGIAGGSSAPYSNRLPYEAGSAIAFGLSEAEALKAVTLSPAQILGIDNRVGSLEPGKDATLLITTGSPLEYLAKIEQAYIQGRKIDMKDAHLALYEKYAEKLRQMRSSIRQ